MWDSCLTHPFGRLSKRNYFFAVVLLATTLVSTIFMTAQPVAAAADASWNGPSQIVYNHRTFGGPITGKDMPNVVPTSSNSAFLDSDTGSNAQIIYFPKGTDPTTAVSAQLISAKYNTDRDIYSNPSPPKKISIDQQPQTADSGESCRTSGAIGWIICPVSDKISHGVDYLYGIVAGFLSVEPLSTSRSNVIYDGWVYMRNVANVAFVIAFMIIIYSQVTNMGLSSYGLKKLLPRLVMAAILMNVSYWVCAVGVDLSNFLGVSLENFFVSLRDGLMTDHGIHAQIPTWGGVTAAVLGLGAVTFAGAAIIVTSGGVLALLLPILVGVALSALVAIIILAARQAILVILIIISPLAFVAFLLPNTEKYFHKWATTYGTLLLMFPIFSILFGGAQLAGGAIILSSHSIVELLFGMAIQVVPLAITPLLIKLSTSSLSQVAGFVNNPKRGAIDRTRNFSKQFSEDQRNRGLAYNPVARKHYHRKRRKEDNRKIVESRNDNLYHDSDGYKKLDHKTREVEREKKRIESQHEVEWNVKLKVDKRQFEKEMESRATSDEATTAKGRVDTMHEELKQNHLPEGIYGAATDQQKEAVTSIGNRMHDATRDVALTSMRKQMTERHSQSQIAEDLKDNTLTIDGKLLREYAGGIMGRSGELSVQSNAKKTVSKQMYDDIQNIKDTMDYDLARDNGRLHTEFSRPDNTVAQRVAYAQTLANNGTDGVRQFRKIMHDYGDDSSVPADDMRDFKELVSTDSGILNHGKDIKLFLKQSRDEQGELRTFESLSNDVGTWTGQSADAFAGQNQATQEHALRYLLDNNMHEEYSGIIRGIRTNPTSLARVNDGVRREFSIYSDVERKSDSSLPEPGTHIPYNRG